MKILYAIQGTGNGHISRARSIIPLLHEHGEVDILVSGMQVDVTLDYPIKYRFQGLGFIFGKNGGIDLLATYRKNKLKQFRKEIRSLPVRDYDLVISDFEPVSAWACLQQNKACIGLSHQAAVLYTAAPHPKKKDLVGMAFLNYYAPATVQYGFHFRAYGTGICTPVIREGVRQCITSEEDHYTVYLPAYSDRRIISMLTQVRNVQWEVFSKNAQTITHEQNIIIRPIDDHAFLESMATSSGVLCGAGFETPAEALFLKKKLMVIPMKGQYEQQCNGATLKLMGVPVLKSLKHKHIPLIEAWIAESDIVAVDYPDSTAYIIDQLIKDFNEREHDAATPGISKRPQFKKSGLQKVVAAYIGA